MSFKDLRVEVVRLCHVQMVQYLLNIVVVEHVLVKDDVMEVLVFAVRVLKMVYNGKFRWIVFEQYLDWHRRLQCA